MDNDELVAAWVRLNLVPTPRFTADSWFAYGYAGFPGLFRVHEDATYVMKINRGLTRALGTLRDEAVLNARAIADRFHGEDLVLMLSGGLDSEYMVRRFLDAGVPFTTLLIRHARGGNRHDLVPALRLAHKLGLDYRFFDIDMQVLIDSGEARELARVSQCKHVGYAPWYVAVRDTPGALVSGFNEPEVNYVPDLQAQIDGDYSKGTFMFHDHERFPAFQKYLHWTDNHRVIPSFYQYSLELWAAYLANPFLVRLVAGQYNRRVHSSDLVKDRAYGLRPRVKYTGYERELTQVFTESEAVRTSMPFRCWSSTEIPYRDLLSLINHPLGRT